MRQSSQVSAERRYAAQTKHDTLLELRKKTFSLYTQLAALRPYKPDQGIQLVIQEFCETLVDYTASAHFQLYRFIDEGTERRTNVLKISEDVYPNIADTTQQILDFNEKYDCEDHCDNLSNLDSDLSRLGEILADRILYEDQVIAALIKDR